MNSSERNSSTVDSGATIQPLEASSQQVRLLILGAYALVLGTSAYFALVVANDNLFGDYWRWTKKLLMPLENGEITFWQYLLGDYSFLNHSHFFTLLLYWLNFKILNINLYLENSIGLLFYLATPLLFYRYLKDQTQLGGNELAGWCLVLVLVFFYPAVDLAWNLVVLEYFYLFLAVWLLLAADRYLRGYVKTRHFILVATIVTLAGDVFGVMAGVASCLLGVMLLVSQDGVKQRAGLICATILALQLLIWIADSNYKPFTPPSKSGAVEYFLQNPDAFLTHVMSGLSQALLPFDGFKTMLPTDRKLWSLITGGSACGLLFVVAFFWLRSKRKPFFPVLLILFALLAIAGAVLSRAHATNGEAMYWARYIRLFNPLVLGMIIACVLMMAGRDALRRKMLALLLLVFAGNFIVGAIQQQRMIVHMNNFTTAMARDMRAGPGAAEQGAPYCKRHDCRPVWLFLSDRRLAYFRPGAAENN